MPAFGFAVPVLPGKQARSVSDAMSSRMAEYEESRSRLGITMERGYEQPTPMGTFVVGYLEAERGFAQTMGGLVGSDAAIDRDFIAALRDVHGFDPALLSAGPPPEVVGEWRDAEMGERKPGLAFCAPLIPGRTEAARAFAEEAFVVRRAELTESRRALGQTVEVVILNRSPQGDIVCVYLEGDDPAEGNRRFAASQLPYDRWFKDQLGTIFPPQIDFDQPVPPVSTVWDWHRRTVRT